MKFLGRNLSLYLYFWPREMHGCQSRRGRPPPPEKDVQGTQGVCRLDMQMDRSILDEEDCSTDWMRLDLERVTKER